MVGVPAQSSVALTWLCTLASVGWLAKAGLQPRVNPLLGTLVMVGGVVSVVHVYATVEAGLVFPHASLAVIVKVRVVTQPTVLSL